MTPCAVIPVWILVALLAAATPPAKPRPPERPQPHASGAVYQPVPAPQPIERFPYDAYTTTDRFDRTIAFYLSRGPSAKPDDAPSPLPLVVCIQGSGCQSVFVQVDTPGGKAIASGGPEAAILRLARDRVRVLAVEKPGVAFLAQPERPGSAEGSTPEFRAEHTLERWTEAVHAAVRAAGVLPGVDASRILATGHSEGAIVAAHLAAIHPAVTHVACLAGGGATQLFDLLDLARAGAFGPPGTPDERVAWLLDGWNAVLADPMSTEAMWLGHPHRRWSTFLAASPLEGVLASRARVFIGQGDADTASSPRSADVLYAGLLARGRDVTYRRIVGGDHGFMTPGDSQHNGWLEMHRAVLDWFLAEPGAIPPASVPTTPSPSIRPAT